MAENLWERLFGRADRGYGIKEGQGLDEVNEALGITPGVSQQVGTQGRTHTTDNPDYYNPDAPEGTPQDIYNIQRDQQFPTQQRQEEERKGFNLFEWIKSIITNPNISSTQASQMLNEAGVMAKDLMMAMNPMGTAYGSDSFVEGPYPRDAPGGTPAYIDPTPIVIPQHTGPTIADPGGKIAVGPHRDIPQPTIPDTGNFTQRVEPTTAMYGSNVPASQMSPRLEQERIFGEFFDMPSTPPVSRAGMGFEDVKARSQQRSRRPSAPNYQTGLLGTGSQPSTGGTQPSTGRTPYQGPGKRGFTPGTSTRQPRRFGPH